jgi:hypothetical protein
LCVRPDAVFLGQHSLLQKAVASCTELAPFHTPTHTHTHTHVLPATPQELAALCVVVQGVDPEGLLACWDYLAFPLLLITDSVRPARTPPPAVQQQQRDDEDDAGGLQGDQVEVAVPAAQSDRVAEATLGEG